MTPSRTGKHRRARSRRLSLPAAGGSAAVALAVVASLSLQPAGASVGTDEGRVALDAPSRPAASSSVAPADVFAGLTSASDSLAATTEEASTSVHEAILTKEDEAERQRAAEKAAREAAERERLASMYTRPLDSYNVSAQYGVRGWSWARGYHTGLDLTAGYGSPIKAVHSGTVTFAGWDGAYGYKVEITHADGTQTWYAHMSSIATAGGSVTTGQTIGYVGSTGNSYGNHLHLEVHSAGGGELNPYTWLQSKGISL